jgi:hypothetical protein
LGPLLISASEPPDTLASRASADVVLVRADEVVDEDLYAGGNVITIEGTIEGDLIVWAFQELTMTGTVEGDIIGYASTARISGTVGGSVRLVGGSVSVTADVGSDLMAIGWSVTTDSQVGRDVLAWSRSLRVAGEVGRDVEGQTLGQVVLDGVVGRDFEMTVGGLDVGPATRVGQDLAYRSGSTAQIDEDATVVGAIVRRSPLEPNVRVRGVRLIGIILGVLAFLWIGLLAIWVMPSTMRLAVESVRADVSKSFFAGLVSVLTPLVLLVAVLVTSIAVSPELAAVILTVAAPFWVAVLALLMIATILAPVPVAIVLGNIIGRRRRSAFGAYVIGAVILLLSLAIPIARIAVFGLVGLVGLGALVRGGLLSRGSLQWAVRRPPIRRHRGRRRRGAGEVDELSELRDRSAEDGGDDVVADESSPDERSPDRDLPD